MSCPCQRHIQQPQVFAQPIPIGQGQLVVAELQAQLTLTIFISQVDEGSEPTVFLPETGCVRQAHQRVFKSLALVNRDDFDQIGIAFEPNHLLITLGTALVHLGEQPPNQGLLTVEAAACGLQQLRQMQEIGQFALPIGSDEPARRKPKLMQGLTQHRQDPLHLPDRAQLAQLFAARVKGFIVAGQPAQLIQGQADSPGGEASAYQSNVLWCRHGPQPMHQVMGFLTFKHRVFVGQIDRGHRSACQFAAYGRSFLAGAHQNRDISRSQRLEGLAGLTRRTWFGKASLRVVEPGDNLLSAACGKAFAHVF